MTVLTKRLILLSIPLITVVLIAGNKIYNGGKEPMETVKDVDLKRYMGVWYEIARFDHRFERNLVGVTATYTLFENGKINVLNQGFLNTLDGKLKQATAKAKIPDINQPGKLKVYFVWLFGADYFILELDKENYSYALVGSSSPKYLWILSRTPKMDDASYNMLIKKAEERGYAVNDLIKVKQSVK
jgi:lipocalin